TRVRLSPLRSLLALLLRSPALFPPTAPPTPQIYTFSLHDALPIYRWYERLAPRAREIGVRCRRAHGALRFRQRQQLLQALQGGEIGRAHVWNSSHGSISYAVFCSEQNKEDYSSDCRDATHDTDQRH